MKQSEIQDAVVRSFAAYRYDQDGTLLAEQVSPVQLNSKWDLARIRNTIFLDIAAISDVAYFVRLVGPDYLRALSISQIASLLREIVRDNYWRIAGDWPVKKAGSLVLDEADIDPVCSHFFKTIVSPANKIFLFPLTSVQVDRAFEFGGWSFIPPPELPRILSGLVRLDRLRVNQMPLFAEEGDPGKPVNCWLAISSPATEHAQKVKRILLGAISLCPLRRDRHLFSMRANSDGYCYITDGAWTASSPAHMPPIEDVVLGADDLRWLCLLSDIMASNDITGLRKRNALEYYYNAWFLTKPERCAFYFSALEAILGAKSGQSTQGLREGIVRVIPEITDLGRLRAITDLRNSIIHGGAPDAYSSKNYQKYYNKYKADILEDVEIITERCLRLDVFGGSFREQPDPHAGIIAKFQGLGVLPTTSRSNAIL